MKHYKVNEAVMQEMINYLVGRPYAEVFRLLDQLRIIPEIKESADASVQPELVETPKELINETTSVSEEVVEEAPKVSRRKSKVPKLQ